MAWQPESADTRGGFPPDSSRTLMSLHASAAKTVLIADDTAFVRERFATALAEAGHEAVTAESAGDLLATVTGRTDPLDLIVLDLHLPHSRGVGLVRQVRERTDARVPILVFSGTVESADEVRELAAIGVAGYINEYSAPHHILPALAPHLFPDSFNRRSSPRVNVAVPISYRAGNAVSSALTLNVGRGGLAIRTMNPPERGTLLRLRFKLPAAIREIEASGRVCWTDRHLGMGVQFEQMTPADQAQVDEYVDRNCFNNRRA